jgi:hypothetical protein
MDTMEARSKPSRIAFNLLGRSNIFLESFVLLLIFSRIITLFYRFAHLMDELCET